MTEIIAIASQKGGVGKTTTALNLTAAFAANDKKVLLIDMDPQCNATIGLGCDRHSAKYSSYELIMDGLKISDVAVPTEIKNLHIVLGSIDLAAIDVELGRMKGREKRLVESIGQHSQYDYIIIDCPPSLGLLTINALCAADSVLIPLQCEFFALDGMVNLIDAMKLVKKGLNPKLSVCGILLTMVDRRSKLTMEVERQVREEFKDLVFEVVIPRNVKLSESVSYGYPALVYYPGCVGALSYMVLASEILKRTATFKAA